MKKRPPTRNPLSVDSRERERTKTSDCAQCWKMRHWPVENVNLPLERYFAQTRNKNKITTRLYVILWSYIIVRKKRNKKAHANTSKNGQIAWSSNFVICETIVSYLIFIFWIFQDEILVTFIMSLVCVFVSPRSRYISYFFIESFCFFLLKTFLIKW